jgi:hypothetical protein
VFVDIPFVLRHKNEVAAARQASKGASMFPAEMGDVPLQSCSIICISKLVVDKSVIDVNFRFTFVTIALSGMEEVLNLKNDLMQ